ncbi:MAG: DUF2842 domain-containing protein [Novosphingobium sp.]|nr:DUF2842 domain-containing protein [Novosphingobium sp.]
MRNRPTWRIPVGVLALLAGLLLYGIAVARILPPLIGHWPGLAQLPVYAVLGMIWLLPMKPYLRWMETGRWR